jgi:uncharacterized RDD family membrane protein YckC
MSTAPRLARHRSDVRQDVAVSTTTGLVTGEAVELDLRLAQLPSRALSATIDIGLQLVVLAAAFLLAFGFNLDGNTALGLGIVISAAVIVGYPATMETLTRGKTLGKMAVGLRTVRTDGGAISFRHSITRALIAVGEIWMTAGVPAVMTSMISPEGRRIGDYAAGTVVLRERAPRGATPQPVVQPYLAHWVANVDVSRVPDGLALALRRYLTRAPELEFGASQQLALGLGTDLLPYLQPPPPQGSWPEHVIAAVVAERRRREELRRVGSAAQPTPSPFDPPVAPPAPTSGATPPYAAPSPPVAPRPAVDPPPAGGFATPS